MNGLKKHGDPLDDEIRPDSARVIEEVANNQPGSKSDGSEDRAGSGGRADGDAGECRHRALGEPEAQPCSCR